MAAVGRIEDEDTGKSSRYSDTILQTNLTKPRIRKKLRKKITLED
jgi:hypothetical protein